MLTLKRAAATAAAAAMALTSAFVAAPAASAAPTNRTVVNAWYEDFLDRDASADPGSQYWVDRLSVQAPGDVLWSITHSAEYNRHELEGIYAFYLSRGLDRGAQYWIEGATAQRFPLEWAQQNILASPEYARNRGNDNTSIVYGWYYNVLGLEGLEEDRPISDGEITYWAGRIRAVGRLGALRELWYSPEAVSGRISDNYFYTLGRPPSGGEINYWYPKEVESDINVQVLIASTSEYTSLSEQF